MASFLPALPALSLDYIFSIPGVSYWLVPQSWSTSLNLLFFTLLWTTIVWTYRPFLVELYSTLAVRFLFYLVPCAFFLSFDAALPALARSFKAQGARALPVNAARQRGQSAKKRITFIVGIAVANVLLSSLAQAAVEALLTEVLHTRSALRMSAILPAPWSMVKDVVRAMFIRGVLMYYIHRFLLHSSSYSPTVSNAHQTYAHSLGSTMAFGAAFDHPVVYLLHRWLPIYLPAVYYRFHIITHLATLALVSLEDALIYSGYTVLPSTILLTGMARRQEKHLASGGRGNFGPYGFLDWLHGTSVDDYDVFDDIRAEAGKHDVQGKAQGMFDKAGEAIRGHAQDRDISPSDQDDAPARRPRRTRK